MIPSASKRARRETVALTFPQIERIMIEHLGFEFEDVAAFWRLACREMAGKTPA
jgi:hypothetical protein